MMILAGYSEIDDQVRMMTDSKTTNSEENQCWCLLILLSTRPPVSPPAFAGYHGSFISFSSAMPLLAISMYHDDPLMPPSPPVMFICRHYEYRCFCCSSIVVHHDFGTVVLVPRCRPVYGLILFDVHCTALHSPRQELCNLNYVSAMKVGRSMYLPIWVEASNLLVGGEVCSTVRRTQHTHD